MTERTTGAPGADTARHARSWLYCPASRPERLPRAEASGADATVVDLEDSVSPAAKPAARRAALAFLATPRPGTTVRAVRINAIGTRAGVADLAAILEATHRPDVLVLPKTESRGSVAAIGAALADAGAHTRLVPLLESAAGIAAGAEIAGCPRVVAVMLGGADLAADLGARPSPAALATARGTAVLAAATAGVLLVDSPCFDPHDAAGLADELRLAVDVGCGGKAAIHPDQVAAVNAAWTPGPDEVAHARRVLEVNRAGVGVLDGQMVDEAVARHARVVLARAR